MMASSIFRDAFRSFTDRIRFGRPHGPGEWLAPDPRGAAGPSFDAGFPAESLGGTAAAPAAAQVVSAPQPAAATERPTLGAAGGAGSDQTPAAQTAAPQASAVESPADETGAASGPAAKKAAAKKTTPRKAAAKKPAAKKPAAKRTAAKKAPARTTRARTAAAEQPSDAASATDAAAAPKPGEGAAASQPEQPAGALTLPVRDGEDPWTEEEIAAVRGELLAEREQLLKEVADADEQLSEMLRDAGDGAVDDQADAGSRTFEREQEISLAADATETLTQVDDALRLLEQGGYGVCVNCGKPIGKLRLQAYPRATLCLACKEQEERR